MTNQSCFAMLILQANSLSFKMIQLGRQCWLFLSWMHLSLYPLWFVKGQCNLIGKLLLPQIKWIQCFLSGNSGWLCVVDWYFCWTSKECQQLSSFFTNYVCILRCNNGELFDSAKDSQNDIELYFLVDKGFPLLVNGSPLGHAWSNNLKQLDQKSQKRKQHMTYYK
jgi:hypothetical protein